MHLRQCLVAISILSACPSFAQVAAREPDAVAALLVGTWKTGAMPTPAPGGLTAYVVQTLLWTEETESLIVTAYADEALTLPIFTYEFIGPYQVRSISKIVPEAFDVDLNNDRSVMTVAMDAPEIWKFLNLQACPLEIGKAIDISTCSSGPPFEVSNCTDMDLVQLDPAGTTLRMGAPGTDRCIARPGLLGSITYIRQ